MSTFIGTPRIPAPLPTREVGTTTQLRVVRMACSVLLEYPRDDLLDDDGAISAVSAALPEMPGAAAAEVAVFCHTAEAMGTRALQEHYVETFDQRRRCALSLTYYSHGDTRMRGQAILAVREILHRAGFEVARNELPDHLPVILEFCARDTSGTAEELLRVNREGIEVIRTALRSADSPYAHLLEALVLTLPAPDARAKEAYEHLISQGPPSETVGITSPPGPVPAPEQRSAPPTPKGHDHDNH